MEDLKRKIQLLCKIHNIFPSKDRGQNFLCSEETLEKIVHTAKITKNDTIVEVGPGFGSMTTLLASLAKKVYAIELDRNFISLLKVELHPFDNVEIIEKDILKFIPEEYGINTYHIVANLPYNITSFFLKKFLSQSHTPKSMVLLIQKEVAQRMCANPGEMSILSFSVQWYASAEIIDYVPRKYFWPEPKVDSAIIRIVLHTKEKIQSMLEEAKIDERSLFRLVKFGFSSKRKQLHNNLTAGLRSLVKKKIDNEMIKKIISDMGLDPHIRAQDLSISDWVRLASTIHKEII